MKSRRLLTVFVLTLICSPIAFSQTPRDEADVQMVNRIWEEGTAHSQVMKTLSYLSDVVGPRVPRSTAMKKAQEWSSKKLEEWGLENVVVESCGNVGLGWSNEYVSAHMTEPSYLRILAYAKPWTSSTAGKVEGKPVMAVIRTKADMETYRGKLEGAIVFTDEPRSTKPVFDPIAKRYTDGDLEKLKETPIPVKPRDPAPKKDELKWEELEEFYRTEEVGLLVESSSVSRSDYGTVKVDAYEGNGKDHMTPRRSPRIVMAAEHYARICRIVELGVPVTLEIEVRNTLTEEDGEGFNVLGEIVGTDKKDELVMLGGHLDSWAGGTGAVDNAAGCAVTMEAVRILKSLGIQPRRTIRIALWTGEETGFYGSRGYVFSHFGDTDTKILENIDWEGYEKNWRRMIGTSTKVVAKPDYDKISGYFNYDNGTGRIRGIYIQENFQVKPIFEAWMKPFHDLGMTTIALQSTEGTDHLPFDWIGIPGFQFVQDPLDYVPQIHHTNQDVFDHCVPEDLIQSAVIMASFVYHTAMREEKLPRKPLLIPVEVQ